METPSGADCIREYARRHYIDPARKRREATVKINAGDVHKGLRLSSRVPQVCAALSSQKFLQENQLSLETRQAPPSGQSTTVTFTYRLGSGNGSSVPPSGAAFLQLRGIARDVFRKLGGGESFVRNERKRFNGPNPKK